MPTHARRLSPALLALLPACGAREAPTPPTATVACPTEEHLAVLSDHLASLRAIHALLGGRSGPRAAIGFLALPGVVVSAGAELSVAEACGSVVVEPVCRDGVCWTVSCGADGAAWDVNGAVPSGAWGAWTVEPSLVLLRWDSARAELLGFTFASRVRGPGAADWRVTSHGTLTVDALTVAERIEGMVDGVLGLSWAGGKGELAVDGVAVAEIDGTGIGAAGPCAAR
jgi:hypothetical protein